MPVTASYVSNTTWPEMAERIRAADSIALTTHTRPDGDALGSVLALARALPGLGKRVDSFFVGPIEPPLRTLTGVTPFRDAEREPPGDEHDLIIVTDTGAWSQLEPIADWLRRNHARVIGVDHHAHGDDVAAERIVDPSASSASEMVVTLLDELGCALSGGSGGVAEAVFVGVATDTGWFRYSNAGPQTYQLAARLLEIGVDKSRLYQIIEETHRPARLALEARALASLEYVGNGEIVILSLGVDDFTSTGGSIEDLTGIVNLPMIVGQVKLAILLSETDPGVTKMSFRAKPLLNGVPSTDVNELARRFGGGGHVFAAGARMQAGLEETKRRLLEELGRDGGGSRVE